MGDAKKAKKAFADYAAMWGWPADKEESKKQWKDFRANMEDFFGQLQEVQKTVIEARKEAWNKVFPKLMEMQDKLAANLPEQAQKGVEKVKEFQEMANKHAIEQADNVIDFCKQGQEQAKAAVTEAVDKIEEKME